MGLAGTGASSATAPQETPAAEAQAVKPAAATGTRHHVVVKGDTLFSLAQRYYGNRSRWRDIYAANRGTLASENSPLKIGVGLKIP
jgi:nucleoid-associated protein YgaU